MRSLQSYLEELDGNATPMSIMGMGNPLLPSDTNVGSEPPIPTHKKPIKKNHKKCLNTK